MRIEHLRATMQNTRALAMCAAGMYRTLDEPSVQRSLRALFDAFPTADVFTAIGVECKTDSAKGSNVSKTIHDVRRAFRAVVAPGRPVWHHHLTRHEEHFTRCNSIMLSQMHKWALCFALVAQRQRSEHLTYDWVLKFRPDITWSTSLDHTLRTRCTWNHVGVILPCASIFLSFSASSLRSEPALFSIDRIYNIEMWRTYG